MKFFNFYDCNRDFATRLVDFVNLTQGVEGVKRRHALIINGYNSGKRAMIKANSNCKTDFWDKMIADAKSERDKEVASLSKFEFDATDRALVKALKGVSAWDEHAQAVALDAWFCARTGVSMRNTDVEYVMLSVMNKKHDWNEFVNSKGIDGMVVASNNTLLKNLYWTMFTACLVAGTVKPQALCKDIAENYGAEYIERKKAERKAQRAEAKAKAHDKKVA